MPGLNERLPSVFANREFIQLQSFAISRSVAEAREETLIAANDTAVAQRGLFHIHVNAGPDFFARHSLYNSC